MTIDNFEDGKFFENLNKQLKELISKERNTKKRYVYFLVSTIHESKKDFVIKELGSYEHEFMGIKLPPTICDKTCEFVTQYHQFLFNYSDAINPNEILFTLKYFEV